MAENLFKKIQDVSNEIKNIEKNMNVGTEKYGYKAVQDIDVILAVKKAEAKFGLISIPVKQELIKSEIVEVIKDNGNKSINYVDIVKLTLRIVNIENPSEFIEVESFGRGLDSGDKGFGKASTYARKYALLNAYKIATGTDPDNDLSKSQKPVDKNKEKEIVVNFLTKDVTYCMDILKFFNLGSLDDLTDDIVNKIYKNLSKKGKL